MESTYDQMKIRYFDREIHAELDISVQSPAAGSI